MGTKVLGSCMNCAALHYCFESLPTSDAARSTCSTCDLPYKGKTVEVVRVIGQTHGMSLKNALRKVSKNELYWAGWHKVAPVRRVI